MTGEYDSYPGVKTIPRNNSEVIPRILSARHRAPTRDISTSCNVEIRGCNPSARYDMMGDVGGYGYAVIDADAPGKEPLK